MPQPLRIVPLKPPFGLIATTIGHLKALFGERLLNFITFEKGMFCMAHLHPAVRHHHVTHRREKIRLFTAHADPAVLSSSSSLLVIESFAEYIANFHAVVSRCCSGDVEFSQHLVFISSVLSFPQLSRRRRCHYHRCQCHLPPSRSLFAAFLRPRFHHTFSTWIVRLQVTHL